jgi:hypothetical protein
MGLLQRDLQGLGLPILGASPKIRSLGLGGS